MTGVDELFKVNSLHYSLLGLKLTAGETLAGSEWKAQVRTGPRSQYVPRPSFAFRFIRY